MTETKTIAVISPRAQMFNDFRREQPATVGSEYKCCLREHDFHGGIYSEILILAAPNGQGTSEYYDLCQSATEFAKRHFIEIKYPNF